MRYLSTLAFLSTVALSEATWGNDGNDCQKSGYIKRWFCTPLTPQYCDKCPPASPKPTCDGGDKCCEQGCDKDKYGKKCPPQLPSLSLPIPSITPVPISIPMPSISKSIGITYSMGASASASASASVSLSAPAPPSPPETTSAPAPPPETSSVMVTPVPVPGTSCLATEISDGQPQAPTACPQAPTGGGSTLVTQISDGQPQAPTATPVSQISDGQPQAPTATPVSQISDGQPQAPATSDLAASSAAPFPVNGTGTGSAPSATSDSPVLFTGGASLNNLPFGANVILGAAVAAALL